MRRRTACGRATTGRSLSWRSHSSKSNASSSKRYCSGSKPHRFPLILRTFHLHMPTTFSPGILANSGACRVKISLKGDLAALLNSGLFKRRGGILPQSGESSVAHAILKRRRMGPSTILRTIRVSGLFDSLYRSSESSALSASSSGRFTSSKSAIARLFAFMISRTYLLNSSLVITPWSKRQRNWAISPAHPPRTELPALALLPLLNAELLNAELLLETLPVL